MNINFSELEEFIARKYGSACCCDGVSVRPYNVVVTINADGTLQKVPVEGINFDFVYWRVSTTGQGVKLQIEHNTGTYDARDLYSLDDVGDRYPAIIKKTAKPNIAALGQPLWEGGGTFEVVLHGALIGG